MKEVLLDTNMITFYFKEHENVVEKMEEHLKTFGHFNISIITYFEVLHGLFYRDAKRQLKRFRLFTQLTNILPLTENSAEIAAKIKAELKRTGKIIDSNDILIAAIALENDLVLATNNVKDFKRIEGIEIEDWKNI